MFISDYKVIAAGLSFLLNFSLNYDLDNHKRNIFMIHSILLIKIFSYLVARVYVQDNFKKISIPYKYEM